MRAVLEDEPKRNVTKVREKKRNLACQWKLGGKSHNTAKPTTSQVEKEPQQLEKPDPKFLRFSWQ